MKCHLAYYLGRGKENAEATFFDRLVCFVTNSRYSHVELIPEYNQFNEYNWGWSSSPRDDGVRSAKINFTEKHWHLYEAELPFVDINTWFESRVGIKYDWLGAIGAHVPLFRNNRERMFCTEVIGQCLKVPNAKEMTPQEMFEYFEEMGQTRVIMDDTDFADLE